MTSALAERRICVVNKALEGLLVPLADLTLDPLNARKHSKRSIDAIAQSLEQFGQQKPIVHKNLTVIAGNGTLQAARVLGWTHLAAVAWDKDDTTALGFRLADNRTADLSTFDDDLLKEHIAYLKKHAPDMELDAFWNKDEFEQIGAPDGDLGAEEIEPSDASMLEKLGVTIAEPKTKLEPGDVRKLGPHVLVVADCVNDAALWFPHMTDEKLFCPYPGPYVTLTIAASKKPCLLVQPDTFIAGHIVDRWEEING